MPVTDPISDLLVRIRNAQAQKHSTVRVPSRIITTSVALLYSLASPPLT